MIQIRDETPDDWQAIGAVNRRAFGGEEEAVLVDRLRAEGDVIVSLVAVEAERIVGHILFSALPIETGEETIRAAALAPLAVVPERQRQGIGGALVHAGLAACRRSDVAAVIVLGDPAYYGRFGFRAETVAALQAPFTGAAFMGLALGPGALDGVTGRICYPAAFGLDGG